jgi:hypothetical protein
LTVAPYTIEATPEGKWRLYAGEHPIHVFDTLEKAKNGMRVIIERKVYHFDASGDEISDFLTK